jgi:hypothetical protein
VSPALIVALLAVGLAMLGIVTSVLSLRADVVTGPRPLAVLVVAALTGAWAVAWFVAQSVDPVTGVATTVALSALVVSTVFGGGPFSTGVIRLADPNPEVPDSLRAFTDQAGPTVRPSPATPDLLRGGALVGVLERAGIVASLLIDFPEGVAVVLAIKGLGRFGELRIPSAPERFIVGSLASVLWALLGYAAIRAVLT